jgi:hypothetical protein
MQRRALKVQKLCLARRAAQEFRGRWGWQGIRDRVDGWARLSGGRSYFGTGKALLTGNSFRS